MKLDDTLLPILYMLAALFILSLKWMNSPARRGAASFAGEVGMLLAIVGTLLRHDVVNYEWIFVGVLHRHGHRSSHRLHHADDGGAAADRALARLRRAGGGAGGHGRILSRHPPDAATGSPWWR